MLLLTLDVGLVEGKVVGLLVFGDSEGVLVGCLEGEAVGE